MKLKVIKRHQKTIDQHHLGTYSANWKLDSLLRTCM